ncbi:MAG: hypothetical protein ACOCQD_03315 [archaeon]
MKSNREKILQKRVQQLENQLIETEAFIGRILKEKYEAENREDFWKERAYREICRTSPDGLEFDRKIISAILKQYEKQDNQGE